MIWGGLSKMRAAILRRCASESRRTFPALRANVEPLASTERSSTLNDRSSETAGFGHTIISVPKVHLTEPDALREKPPDDSNAIVLHQSSFRIRLADTPQGRNAASVLINKMYSWRGYGDSHQLGDSPNRITLTASDHDRVVGTATLGLDSPSGLLADSIFKAEIDAFRSRGAKLCEITKLAFDPSVQSKSVIASLFHILFVYGRRRHRCTDVFIEVNPRHRAFYQRMLGFEAIGDVKSNPRVNAPAFLLWADISYIESQIQQYGGRIDLAGSTRSLYPYFFSPREEDGIAGRLLTNI